jgi:hypothetical protein
VGKLHKDFYLLFSRIIDFTRTSNRKRLIDRDIKIMEMNTKKIGHIRRKNRSRRETERTSHKKERRKIQLCKTSGDLAGNREGRLRFSLIVPIRISTSLIPPRSG